jgi:hypothetical protein
MRRVLGAGFPGARRGVGEAINSHTGSSVMRAELPADIAGESAASAGFPAHVRATATTAMASLLQHLVLRIASRIGAHAASVATLKRRSEV